jgi:nanoRNase/pAp phosphatase (c-di-AMP/oligoRNAs hydrolase)
MGKSILNRTNPVDIGALCLQHGGGGHAAAGTCQIPAVEADQLVPSIVQQLDRTLESPELAEA